MPAARDHAEAPSRVTTAEAQVRALRERSNAAIAARDVEGVVALMHDDIAVAVAGGPVLRGREANRTAWADQMAEPGYRGYLRTPQRVQVAGDGRHASEHGTWEGRWQTPAGVLVQRGTYIARWTLSPLGWRLVSERYAARSA